MQKNIILTNGLTLTIMPAGVDDAEQIVNFLNTVGGETDFLTFGAHEFQISVVDEQATITECLERNSCLMLVGKIGNELVSQLFLQRSDKTRLAHMGDVAISVCKKYWGQAIGRCMMVTAIEWAQSNGITKMQLQVRTDNDRAVQLYKKLGFSIEGTITRSLRIGNTYFDDYLMGLQL